MPGGKVQSYLVEIFVRQETFQGFVPRRFGRCRNSTTDRLDATVQEAGVFCRELEFDILGRSCLLFTDEPSDGTKQERSGAYQ